MRDTPGSIPTRLPSPTCTRISSRKGSSPARASMTSTRSRRPSRDAFPKMPCSRTTCSRGCTRAPRWLRISRSWTTTRRASWPTPAGSTAGSGVTGNCSGGCCRWYLRGAVCGAIGCRRSRAGSCSTTCAAVSSRRPRYCCWAADGRGCRDARECGRSWDCCPWRCRSCPGCRACSAGRLRRSPGARSWPSRRRRFRVRPRGRPCSSRSWRTTRGSEAMRS